MPIRDSLSCQAATGVTRSFYKIPSSPSSVPKAKVVESHMDRTHSGWETVAHMHPLMVEGGVCALGRTTGARGCSSRRRSTFVCSWAWARRRGQQWLLWRERGLATGPLGVFLPLLPCPCTTCGRVHVSYLGCTPRWECGLRSDPGGGGALAVPPQCPSGAEVHIAGPDTRGCPVWE